MATVYSVNCRIKGLNKMVQRQEECHIIVPHNYKSKILVHKDAPPQMVHLEKSMGSCCQPRIEWT